MVSPASTLSRSSPPPFPPDPFPFCLLKNRLLRDKKKIKYKMKQELTHQSCTRQTEGKQPKKRCKNQRPTCSHTQESHKNPKLEP